MGNWRCSSPFLFGFFFTSVRNGGELSPSRLYRYSLGKYSRGHWIGMFVGPRACRVAWEQSLLPPPGFESRYPLNRRLGGPTAGVEKTNILCTCRCSDSGTHWIGRRLGGPQSRPGRCGRRKMSCPCRESNPGSSSP